MAPGIDLLAMAPVMRNPPIYTLRDLKTWVTVRDLMDAHEILDLESAFNRAAQAKAKRESMTP